MTLSDTIEAVRNAPDSELGSCVSEALEKHPADPELTIACCSRLLQHADKRPMDEPERHEGPAWQAQLATQKALSENPVLRNDLSALLWINRGNALRMCGASQDGAARQAFEQAIALVPDHGPWLNDFAVLHKWRGRFEEGLSLAKQAHEALAAAQLPTKAALWNSAICATALGEGEKALKAWEGLGIPATLPEGSALPMVEKMPSLHIRVLSRGTGHGSLTSLPPTAVAFEVLNVAPISPCHGVVQTPSFYDAPVDFGDVVLWDGRPVAQLDGPVFPVLEILNRAKMHRFRFVAGAKDQDALRDFLETPLKLGDAEVRFWPRTPALSKVADAAGTLRVYQSDTAEPQAWVYGKLTAPADIDLKALGETLAKRDGIALAVPELYESLGNAKRTGQEHQSWAAIERRFSKV